MDFHPTENTALLFGTETGEIGIWDLTSLTTKCVHTLEIWDLTKCTDLFQVLMAQNENKSLSVNRVTWSSQGGLVGVAFSKHLIQVYAATGIRRFDKELEVDAHLGSVNDLSFVFHNNQTCVVTCGDDKLVNVWNLEGQRLYRFEGHNAPVFSLCLHKRENVQYIFSADDDGKIKAWCCNNTEIMEYDALENLCTRLRVLQSTDKTRMFSCGTSKLGDTLLVEWDYIERSTKRTYTGYSRVRFGVVDFDTAKNRFLAVGEPNEIKIWSMDCTEVLTNIPFPDSLKLLGMPSSLRFNIGGNILAASNGLGGLYILANATGCRELGIQEV